VSAHDNGATPASQRAQRFPYELDRDWINSLEYLVDEQAGRIPNECEPYLSTPALTGGIRSRASQKQIGQTQRLDRGFPISRPKPGLNGIEVFAKGQTRNQVLAVGKIEEPFTRQLGQARADKELAIQSNPAAIGSEQAGADFQQRRFPRSHAPEQGNDLTWQHAKTC
jgi:hypothetical protein